MQIIIIEKPTTVDNLSMFEYQFGYMWRYLMWNFVGRQMTTKGVMELRMETGLVALNLLMNHVGSQDNLPADILNNGVAMCLLPFLLGLIGLMYHTLQNMKSFVLLVLFLFTGFALKIYLNERPFEPRERDYALVGSFICLICWFWRYSLYESAKNI
jgi:fatty acid desaturase